MTEGCREKVPALFFVLPSFWRGGGKERESVEKSHERKPGETWCEDQMKKIRGM